MKTQLLSYLLGLAVCLALLVAAFIQPFGPVAIFIGALFSAGFGAALAFLFLLCVGTLVSLVLPNPDGRIETSVLLAVLGFASLYTVTTGHDFNGVTGALGAASGDALFFWMLYRLR